MISPFTCVQNLVAKRQPDASVMHVIKVIKPHNNFKHISALAERSIIILAVSIADILLCGIIL